MIDYAKHFYSNKTMSFKVIDNKILKTYTKIWKRVSSLMNIKFDSESVYGDNVKYIKTRIRSYRGEKKMFYKGKKYQKEIQHISVYH